MVAKEFPEGNMRRLRGRSPPFFVMLLYVLFAILLSPVGDVAGASERVESEKNVTTEEVSGPSLVQIGILAKRGAEQCLEKWGATAEYLNNQLPGYIFTILPLDFDEIRIAVEKKDVDFILANSSYYVDLEVSLGVKRIATLNNLHSNGIASNTFAGTLVVRKDRQDITTVKDLRGKTFMAVDPRSLGGWHMVLRELKQEGINPNKDFKRFVFGGTHDKVVLAVWSGQVDAGTVRSDTLERMAYEGKIDLDDFKVLTIHHPEKDDFPFLHSTRHYPEWPFAMSAHTSENLAKLVTVNLLQMESGSPAAKAAQIQGWTIPQNYQSVHECLQELQLSPYDRFESLTLLNFYNRYRLWILAGGFLVVIFLGIGKLVYSLMNKLERIKKEREEREKSAFFLNSLMESIPIPIYYKGVDGKYAGVNKAYEAFVGIPKEEVTGKSVYDIHPTSLAGVYREKDEELLSMGGAQRFETKIKTAKGILHDVILEKAVFYDRNGEKGGLIGVILDITENKLYEKIMSTRLELSEYSTNHSIKELIQKVLDEAEQVSRSQVSFFHFLEPDQETLSLQMWSSNTMKGCTISDGDVLHYPLERAGVWCDCIREKKPVIHNNYQNLPNKKGLPDGHAPVVRVLTVPVFRDKKIVAILGVGNKEEQYLERDVWTVSKMAEITWDLVLKKQAEEETKESEGKYQAIMDAMEDSIYICSAEYLVEYTNSAMIKRVGRDITGERCYEALYGLDAICEGCVHDKVMMGEFITREVVDPHTGEIFHVANAPLYKHDDCVSKLTVFRDITDIKRMEAHLQQAQKMEAIGTLAGGIAHDFNNILCPMLGFAELLKNDLGEDEVHLEHIRQILAAGFRAKDLIGQILSFSRHNVEEIKPINLQIVVKEALKLLRSSIPATIEITSDIDPDCGQVMADATQCHQVIMNLTTNAYHAMEKSGGRLEVRLQQVNLSDQDFPVDSLLPGNYACISVKDTGVGIDPAILDKIFDPYFTTKDKGKGTGLGLAVVKGIIQSYDGDIWIQSNGRKGTEIKVFMPVLDDAPLKTAMAYIEELPKGSERILVIDDERSITHMMKAMLERLGYIVTTENDGSRALRLLLEQPDKFDLVITDMLMPHVTGIKIAEQLRETSSQLPIILCTGYQDSCDHHRIQAAGIKVIINKPFTKFELAEATRTCLDLSVT